MSCYRLESSLGYSVTKKSNIDLIEDGKLIFIVGNTIQILNIDADQNKYGKFNDDHIIIHGHSDGIGAFAIHPSKECFAFGEIGHIPDIHIYSYPQLTEQKVLANVKLSPLKDGKTKMMRKNQRERNGNTAICSST